MWGGAVEGTFQEPALEPVHQAYPATACGTARVSPAAIATAIEEHHWAPLESASCIGASVLECIGASVEDGDGQKVACRSDTSRPEDQTAVRSAPRGSVHDEKAGGRHICSAEFAGFPTETPG